MLCLSSILCHLVDQEDALMRLRISAVLIGLLFVSATSFRAAQAQPNLVKVRVRVILVDQGLNQKAVPFFVVSLKGGAKVAEVKTSLDGTAEAHLAPGRYTVSTPKAAGLGSKRFSWDVQG